MLRRALVVMLVLIAFPAAAHASKLKRSGDQIVYEPSFDTVDNMSVEDAGNDFVSASISRQSRRTARTSPTRALSTRARG
jgi:hypothetical protein